MMPDEEDHGRSLEAKLKDKDGERTEWNFPAVGTGYIDFSKTFEVLSSAGNEAPLSIEIEFTAAGPSSLDEVHEALATSADNTRKLLAARAIERKLLEKLKERQNQQYIREEQLKEQRVNDETATLRYKAPAL